MTQPEKHLWENMDGSAAYWQYLHKSGERDRRQLHEQASEDTTDGSGIMMFAILFTIGFLALLAIATLRNML
jgi:hypothetical protein